MCEKCLYVSWIRGYKLKQIREHFPNQTSMLSDRDIQDSFKVMITKKLCVGG